MNISIVGKILMGVVLLAGSTALAAPSNKPNILIVLTDDQGYGDLSCHGNPFVKTPCLDRLHDQAIRFTDFHVAGICTPSRAQLMTGVDNLRNRACQWGFGMEFMRRDIPTIAEMFGAAGYRTGQFGKWHLGDMFPHRPSDRGFQESVRYGGASVMQSTDYWDNDGFDDHYWHNDVITQYHGYYNDIFFNEAMRFMKEAKGAGKPFLTYLATPAVHDPCFVADKYRAPYKKMTFKGKPLPPEIQSFYGMIANLDENMGRLEQFLDKEGLRDNTIVIFMSDNGGFMGVPFYDAGMSGGKGSLLEGGHRQSCFIRWPEGGLRAPGDVAGITEIQDLAPTLLDLCGVAKPPVAQFDGMSLAPLLRGQPQDLSERMTAVQWGWGGKGYGTVLWKRWRLTGGQEGWQLHDLTSDPYQKSDVRAQHPEVAAKMLAYYEDWWRGVEPAMEHREYPHIGDDRANPVTLCCFDWIEHQQIDRRFGGPAMVYRSLYAHGANQKAHGATYNLTIQTYVRNGMAVHGKWKVRAVQPGAYKIALRRWPEEVDVAMIAALPLQKLTDTYPESGFDRSPWYGSPQAGVALPIASAKARFAGQEQTVKVGEDDRAVELTFTVAQAGEVELETWFYDAKGREICSAYYVVVGRK